MLAFNTDELMALTISFLLPFFRIGAFLMALPLFGSQLVSTRVRLLFAFVLAIIITPLVPMPQYDPFSPAFVLLIAEQLIIGIVLGFVVTVLLLPAWVEMNSQCWCRVVQQWHMTILLAFCSRA